MHTTVTVVIADAKEGPALTQAFDEAFAVFEDIDATMNEWKPESALGRINAQAGGAPVRAEKALCDVLRRSLSAAKRTGGLFDPTWAALRSVWSFGDGEVPRVPDPAAVKAACALVSYKDVEVTALQGPDKGACHVRLRRAGMKLGLGGVAKGWGVDQAVARLRTRGFSNFFIQAGGDLFFAGKNGDRPWRAGVRDPRGSPNQTFAMMDVTDRAFSTSGDYEHSFEVDGRRYHHIMDLRTCYPAEASRSATVLARTATDAEFLTKAVFIKGGHAGIKLAKSFGAEALIVDSQNAIHLSKALVDRVELSAPTP